LSTPSASDGRESGPYGMLTRQTSVFGTASPATRNNQVMN
jgi:hypothetical protein